MPKRGTREVRGPSENLTPKRQDPDIFEALVNCFGKPDENGEKIVIPEWDVAKDAKDVFDRNSEDFVPKYIPRIDFAVGPFNITGKKEENVDKIMASGNISVVNQILRLESKRFESHLITCNSNPRCRLAVEVESSTGRKHRMGSILNASLLGLYGVVVAKENKDEKEEKIFESLRNIRTYIELARLLGKTPLTISNVIITKKSSFLEVLRQYQSE